MTYKNDNKPAAGIAYLVGAGPGDPGLLTIRGKELIETAQTIVYDYLADSRLLSLANDEAELIYVGKQAGQHTMPQDEIDALLVKLVRSGKTVVRLKGGDPFIFGRGGEEALALAHASLPFEIVPGITAGAAVPAYAGIPVTHRGLATSVSFITGHEDPTKNQSQINWNALATIGGTLVFYMGVKNLPLITQQLIDHGMPTDTPAAVIANGTKSAQRSVTGTIATIADIAQKAAIKPPAITVIGQVAALQDQLQWYEAKPLLGKSIAITRARAQASSLAEKLQHMGANVIEFPTIKIEPPTNTEPLEVAIVDINQYDWIVFTSVNGVDAFFNTLYELGLDIRRISTQKFCAIGPATAERIRHFGIIADLMPEKFVAESIADAFLAKGGLAGQKVLLPRADIARSTLVELLEAMDAQVTNVEAYKTVPDTGNKDQLTKLLEDDQLDWITFSSSSTVRNFFDVIPPESLTGKKVQIASIGPITSKTIYEYGISCFKEADSYTLDGVIDIITSNSGNE